MAATPQPALELADVLRVQSLFIVPSSSSRQAASQPSASSSTLMHRLAPIEMAAQSIHLAPPVQSRGSSSSSSLLNLPPPPSQNRLSAAADLERQQKQPGDTVCQCPPRFCVSDPASATGPIILPPTKQLTLRPACLVPVGYACCGLALCLCHVLAPGYVQQCGILLAPPWTLILALHAVAQNDTAWFWLGLLTTLLLPSAIILAHHDLLFAGFYLVVFAGFASGRFWQTLQGPTFLLVSLCWFGLASSLALGIAMQDHHPGSQFAAAAFFALAAGSLSASRLRKISLTVGV